MFAGAFVGTAHATSPAAAANDLGWRVIYLGTSLPALEIAGAAIQHKARAVALSIVFPGADPNLPQEMESLRKHLPADIEIIVGGRASESYTSVFKQIRALQTSRLKDLYRILEQLRMPI